VDQAAVVILPIPYEGGVSYGTGTAQAPEAVIAASHQMELYDEDLRGEPFRIGIATLIPPALPKAPADVQAAVHGYASEWIDRGKFVVLIGGDHSISTGLARALHKKYGSLSVVQIDAHSDLRDTYENSRFSHACVMSRIRELTDSTLQIGIRSMSGEEAHRIEHENLAVCTMSMYRDGLFDLDAALDQLLHPVFLTVDVDAFDWSVIHSTGTPEPGGFRWDEAMALLGKIFDRKRVVGFDVVELAARPHDANSPFAVAKLIYKMLGFKLASAMGKDPRGWPLKPQGNLF
jgi:agmatinase